MPTSIRAIVPIVVPPSVRRTHFARRGAAVSGWRYSSGSLSVERSGAGSGICEPPFRREQTGRPPLKEDDDDAEDDDLGPDGLEDRLEELVDHAEPEAGPDGAGELADAAGHDDEERVDDVVAAHVGRDALDGGEGATGHAGEPGAQGEGVEV